MTIHFVPWIKRFQSCSLIPILTWFTLIATGITSPAKAEPIESSQTNLSVTRIQIDGKWQDANADLKNGVLRLSSGVHALSFQFSPILDTDENCLRLRHRLDGLEKDWRESGSPGMRVVVRFQNAAHDFLDEYCFYVLGDSDGWGGSLSNSIFTPRQERLVVPEGSVNIVILLISGGSVETLGLLAIDDLKLSVLNQKTDQKTLWIKDDFEEGKDLDLTTGEPRDWSRGGLRRDFLEVIRYGDSLTNHALAAVDTHVRSYGEWTRSIPLGDRVKAGDVLIMEWNQLFSVGYGKVGRALYEVVPPGQYVFRVAGVAPDGKTVANIALPIYVPQHFWWTVWFVLSCWVVVAIVAAVLVRYLTRRRMKLQMERLEWQRSLERERARIARDIHDDLGAGLTRISMLSSLAHAQASPSTKPQPELNEIIQTARDLVGAMDEIVWAVNPKYDKLDSLIAYCGKFAQDFLNVMGIRCRLDLAFDVPDWTLTSQMRHNLFLAFKEALNNAARHAKAQTVVVAAKMDTDTFVLSVHDDGHGFDNSQARAGGGNGLANMHHRLNEIGGKCTVESFPGKGTTIKFSFRKPL